MPRIAIYEKQKESREYSFTVVFEPLNAISSVRKDGKRVTRPQNAARSGYQVTVPLLPGVITYGRTLAEAREMARDAIRCHLEGLRKDGERIPNEKTARKEKLRVALSA
jgi:predicted RNase H-like HicB family nuclease